MWFPLNNYFDLSDKKEIKMKSLVAGLSRYAMWHVGYLLEELQLKREGIMTKLVAG